MHFIAPPPYPPPPLLPLPPPPPRQPPQPYPRELAGARHAPHRTGPPPPPPRLRRPRLRRDTLDLPLPRTLAPRHGHTLHLRPRERQPRVQHALRHLPQGPGLRRHLRAVRREPDQHRRRNVARAAPDDPQPHDRPQFHNRFRAYELRASREKVENCLIPLLRRLAESNAAVDLQDVFLRLTFDTTCSMVLGVDPGCLSDGFPIIPFAKALDDASEAIFYRHVVPKIGWKVMKWLEIGRERKLAAAARVMDAFVDETIAARRKKVDVMTEGETIEPADLLTTYMQQSAGNRNSVEFVEFDRFLHANAKNLLLAGRSTTATTLTWFFWLLSKNPDVEKAIVEELKANWPGRPASKETLTLEDMTSTPFVDREALGKLVYLHAALCESLRLYPPVAIQHKGVSRADVLPSGHQVWPGLIMIFHLYSMGRMEGIWGKDCIEFRPERWIARGEIKHEPAHKFLAFNCGPRSCLGKDMAFNTMKTVVAAMLYNFHVEVVEGHVVEPKLAIILHMKYGLMVRIKKRDKSSW